jgi:subtilase family serine protease
MTSMPASIFSPVFANASRLVSSCTRKRGALVALCVALLFATMSEAQQLPQVLHHHVRPAVSSGQATLVGTLPATQMMRLTIVLPLRNQAELTTLLGQLYDPSSPKYRHFLRVDQFTRQFSPAAEDYQAVVDFAEANGFTVTATPANRLIVPITGTVAQVEKTFNVQMNVYQHPTEKRTFFSPDREPSLNLSVTVAHIAGLNNFSVPRSMAIKATTAQARANTAVGSGPGSAYLASDMRAAYYGGEALTGNGQTVGLVEFDGYNISDVTSTFDGTATSSANGSNYILAYAPTTGGTTYNIPVNNVLLDGATGAPVTGTDAEETLDIVQAIGMAPGLSQVRVYIGSSDVDILNAMATENLAQQLSISWTWSPDDPSTDDFIFQELAAQGQSIFAASGDYGAYDPFVDYYYPAEDAWVTTAGGTDLTTNSAGGPWSAETAWDQSGGGISPDGIPIPSWQAGVANAANGGSTTLRNVPDVAAEADFDNYDCNMGVCQGDWGGTSFAAPRWAGFMALVNQQAVNAGNPVVGFVNPAIYVIGEDADYESDFHDIISGNNYYFSGSTAFNAVPGYDLVTGWGSPNGQDLINALAPLAAPGFQLSASPSNLIINPGASGTTTITVQDLGGFTGSVNLSISGLPSGVTAAFTPNPVTGSGALTLTVSSSAIRASYLLTITGTSGSMTESTSLALQVNAPGFSIAPSPASIQLSQGGSTATTISVTDYAGFNSSVNLAVTSALPSGVTAIWGANPTTGSSLLTLSASNSATTGNSFVLTITGSSGALSETATVAVTMTSPDFFLNTSPIPWTLYPGDSASATITVVPNGNFAGPVTLSAYELPPGVTATFNPNPITGTGMVTMTASSTAPAGTSWVVIEGSNPGATSYAEFQETITAAPTPTFTVGVSPSSLTLAPGSSGTTTVNVSELNGFTGNLTLSATQLPNGVSASFGTNPTSGSSALTLTTSSSVTAGVYPLSIFATNASGTQSSLASLYLIINPAPGFTLSASPASITIVPGTSVTDTITVLPQTGFSGSVSLVAYGLPSSITASFNPSSTTGTSVLTLTASSTATLGMYPVTIIGTSTTSSGIEQATASMALQVSTQGFSLPNSNFGAVNIGTTSPPMTITFNTSIATILGSTTVLTQGASGLDFINANTGTCTTNTALAAGQSCTINVTFTPKFSGTRNGAVVLEDDNGNVLATGYLQGTGVGPQVNFLPNTESTVASSGLANPWGVAVDGSGNVYILDSLNNRVLKETLSGGSYTQSTIPTSSLNYPTDLAVDGNGNVYIADTNNYRVLKETPAAGGYSESIVADLASSGSQIVGVAVDGYGNVYFTYDLGTVYIETWLAGSYTQSTIQIPSSDLEKIAVDGEGNIYVNDIENDRVLKETPSAGGYTQSTVPTSGLSMPWGIAVDGNGNLYITDTSKQTVVKETPSAGSYIQTTILTSQLSTPSGVAVDESGNVYIADSNRNRVLKEDFADAPSLTFANTVVGSTSTDSPRIVTVENAGNAALNFSAVSFPSSFPESSQQTTDCAATTSLPANGSCTLTVNFSPLVAGTLSGSLVLTDNALNGAPSTQSILLTGTGIPAPSFTLAASPASLTVVQGNSATSTITVTGQNGFSGGVTLAASGLPSGVTAAFGTNPTTGSSALTFTASSTASTGTATATITGTSGSLTATTTVAVTVNPAPSFTLAASPASLTLVQGNSATSTITVTGQNGFSGGVTLSASGLPSGVTAAFGTNPTTGSSVLTFMASTTASTGTTAVTVTGTSGSLTATTTVAVTVNPAPSFTLSASPGSLTVVQGNSATSTITVAGQNGFSGSVTLVASGLPSGVTAAFGTNPTTGSSVLTLTASSTATTGTATVTIKGTSGSLSATTTVAVTVNPAPSFTIAASPTSLTVVRGNSATSTITVTGQNGFSGSVTLAASGLPSGLTAAFGTNPTTGSSVLTLTASGTATTGTATVTIKGTSGTLSATTTVALTVNPAPSFTLAASPASLTVVQGNSATSTITVTGQNGFSGSVTLAASGLPSGVTVAFGTNPTTGSSVLTLTASSTATTGTATVTIKGTSGSLSATTTVALTVNPAPSFTIAASPTSLTITQGSSGRSTITITSQNSFSSATTLSATGLPKGVTTSFSPSSVTPRANGSATSTLTLTASSSATTGTATVTVTGTSGSITKSTTIVLTIDK